MIPIEILDLNRFVTPPALEPLNFKQQNSFVLHKPN